MPSCKRREGRASMLGAPLREVVEGPVLPAGALGVHVAGGRHLLGEEAQLLTRALHLEEGHGHAMNVCVTDVQGVVRLLLRHPLCAHLDEVALVHCGVVVLDLCVDDLEGLRQSASATAGPTRAPSAHTGRSTPSGTAGCPSGSLAPQQESRFSLPGWPRQHPSSRKPSPSPRSTSSSPRSWSSTCLGSPPCSWHQ